MQLLSNFKLICQSSPKSAFVLTSATFHEASYTHAPLILCPTLAAMRNRCGEKEIQMLENRFIQYLSLSYRMSFDCDFVNKLPSTYDDILEVLSVVLRLRSR